MAAPESAKMQIEDGCATAGVTSRDDAPGSPDRKLLVIDTSNTFEMIKARGTEDSVTCRDIEGFFGRVWSVHPLATLTTSENWTSRYGPPVAYRLNERHVFVEGKIGRFPWLRRLFLLNFLMSQTAMFVWLYRLIRRERISVIRAGDPLYTGLMAWALARLTGIPFVIRLGADHDKYYEVMGRPVMPRLFRRRRYEKMVEQFVLRRADLIAGANSDYVRFAISSGARKDRTTLFAYGNLLDRRHFVAPSKRRRQPEILQKFGLERGGFLLHVGRLIRGKRPDDVIRVLAELRSRGHDLKAMLAGDGEMRPSLESLARELNVEPYVVFPGDCSQEWLAEFISSAAVVLSPVTGRALSEVALGGAPVVAYDVDWQGDIIKSGVTGEIVPYADWKAMAQGAERLLNDPQLAARMGRSLRRKALDMFDIEKLNEHERRSYASILRH